MNFHYLAWWKSEMVLQEAIRRPNVFYVEFRKILALENVINGYTRFITHYCAEIATWKKPTRWWNFAKSAVFGVQCVIFRALFGKTLPSASSDVLFITFLKIQQWCIAWKLSANLYTVIRLVWIETPVRIAAWRVCQIIPPCLVPQE